MTPRATRGLGLEACLICTAIDEVKDCLRFAGCEVMHQKEFTLDALQGRGSGCLSRDGRGQKDGEDPK